MPRKANPLKSFRRDLYKAARLIGDITAITEGTIVQRFFRRFTGKMASRGLGSITRHMKGK